MKIEVNVGSDRDEISEAVLKDLEDESLIAELDQCCNPNCLVINEVRRRFNNLKKGLPSGEGVTGD